MHTRLATLVLVGLAALLPAPAWAHKESDAYVQLRLDPANPDRLSGQFDIALRDLDFALGIDSNHDGAITWGEVRAHREAIERYVLPTLTIQGDGLTCPLTPRGQMIDEHSDGAYDVILFDAVCDKEVPDRLTLHYRLFEQIDPYHRGIVSVFARGQISSAVLGPQNPSITLDINRPDRWRQFKSFVIDGIWHIWTGPDHLLFILSLLLPSVLICRRRPRTPFDAGDWQPAERFWPATIELIKVISGFTVSHSVTLSLSVLGFVDLPSRLVESGIALSVMVAAFNNIYPMVTRRAWVVAFAFGFIHGLGFASALAGLRLPAAAMALSLGGFNVGVELGQESVVMPLMIIAFAIRATRLYRIGVMRVGSWLIVVVAGLWLVQRAFDLMIPGFGWLTPS
ncbi:MAG TPA: HupE/UreJ family protein [Steroidobacteraceae bacterium]|nr:HupE/UreJ family protein [Steroidobacteraceae bacterium]